MKKIRYLIPCKFLHCNILRRKFGSILRNTIILDKFYIYLILFDKMWRGCILIVEETKIYIIEKSNNFCTFQDLIWEVDFWIICIHHRNSYDDHGEDAQEGHSPLQRRREWQSGRSGWNHRGNWLEIGPRRRVPTADQLAPIRRRDRQRHPNIFHGSDHDM